MQFLVLGMHRSGTSALARVLNLMGCFLGPDEELTPGDEANPTGYYERKDVWALDEHVLELCGASWYDVAGLHAEQLASDTLRAAFARRVQPILARLEPHRPWAVKDPRQCLLLPLWLGHLERPVAVLLHRDPLEVARSLDRRDGFPLAAGLGLWERYTRDALLHSAGLPRVLVSYAALLREPLASVRRLHAELVAQGVAAGLAPPAEAELRDFLDPALHRQRAAPGEALEYLSAPQRALLRRLEGPDPLSAAPPSPLSAAGHAALAGLAREQRRFRSAVELHQGMLREKDRYIEALQEQARSHEALLGERERELEQLRGPAPAEPAPAEPAPAEPAPPDWSNFAACTIVSRNYLSLARTCCRSFLEQHPGARAFVLIVDSLEGLDPAAEAFALLSAAELGIPDFDDFAFKYNILELNTAVKPYFLERLFERHGVERLVYLDPDVCVYGPFLELREVLDAQQIVLTPHALTALPKDGRRPSENDFLTSGAYNLGFVALKDGPDVRALLGWWQARLYDGAYSDPARGLFTDQKWMDLVPGLFDGVAVLRHPGYNVAYWNLHERSELSRDPGGQYLVNGAPLRFFHFSGYDKRHPQRLSKHQDRYRVPDLNRTYRALFEDYGRTLDRLGWAETHGLPYAYGLFDDGTRIPDLARRSWVRLGEQRLRFGNPFEARRPGSFFEWLTRPRSADGVLSPLLLAMRELRADLQAAFPDPEGRDLVPYLSWVGEHAGSDFGLGEAFTNSFRAALQEARRRATPAAPPAEPAAAAPPVEGPAQSGWKRLVAAVLGEERYRALRRELVWPLYYRLRRQPPAPEAAVSVSAPPFGVNLLGYFDTESGVGEVARGLAQMLAAADLPHALVNVEQGWLRRGDRRVERFAGTRPYAVNVLVVNADQLPAVYAQQGLSRSPLRYDVGYWFWELAQFPERFAPAWDCVDEVWVASDFCQRAIARGARGPVLKLVPAVTAPPAGRKARAHFGFGAEDFVFVYVFDSASVVKRKNPGALISAFRRAFSPDEPARLVLKTVNATARQLEAYERLAGPARVQVLNGYVAHGEVLDLIAAGDAYVSLHRGEGFGLTLLDALLLDKPVIATPYGGVTEFFHGPGTYPVAFREVGLARDHGPYPKGARWADADVPDAVRQLRAVYAAWRDPARRPAPHAPALSARFGAAETARALVERLEAIRERLAARQG